MLFYFIFLQGMGPWDALSLPALLRSRHLPVDVGLPDSVALRVLRLAVARVTTRREK
jgi:hypothetical protein